MVDKRKAGTGRSRGPTAEEVATTTAAKEAPASRPAAKRDRAGAVTKHEPAGRAPRPAEGRAPEKDVETAEKTEKTGAKTVVAKKKTTAVPTPAPAAAAVPKAREAARVTAAALPVRPGEDPWTAEEVEEMRDGLEADAERLEAEILTAEESISGLMRDSGEGAGEDEADAGSKNISREHEMALANNARQMLAQNKHALERLDSGAYGFCESCGSPIGKARLQAFPRATLCVECKQKQERR